MNKNGVNNLIGSPATFLRKVCGLLLMGIALLVFLVSFSMKVEISMMYIKLHNAILLSVGLGTIGFFLVEKKINSLKSIYDLIVWISFFIGGASFLLIFFSKGWDIFISIVIMMISIISFFYFQYKRRD